MLKRAALAQTLAYSCDLILMDEPFGALDAQLKLQLHRELLRIWAQERRTIMFVTHDIEEAIALSETVVVLGARPGHVRALVPVDTAATTGSSGNPVYRGVRQSTPARLGSVGGHRMSSAVPMTNALPMINPARIREHRLKRAIWLSRIGLLVVILAAWQGFGPLIGDLVASSPIEVARALGEYATGQLGPDLLATLEEVVFGYLIGAVGGVIFGVVLASSRVIAGVLDPFIIGLYGIPKIAFGPLLVVWLGIDLAP